MATCTHCGTGLSSSDRTEFCCGGCEFVHRLIHDEGLERFYDLRNDATGQPVLDRPFQRAEFGWLAAQQERAEAQARDDERAPRLDLHVRGISCIGCVWLIEKLFARIPGAGQANVHPSDARLELSWEPGACDLTEFAAELQRFGYGLAPFRPGARDDTERRALAGRLGLCGAFALNSMVFTLPRYLGMGDDFFLAGIFELITLLSATLALLVGGSFFIVRAVAALRRRVLHIDLPIALGIVAAYLGSLAGWSLDAERLLYFDFVAVFTFLMLGGRYLQVAATARVRRNLAGDNPLPAEVTLDDGSAIPLADLEAGCEFRVPSGGVVPVASILRDPGADFSLAWMTGEPAPVIIHCGRRVAAGAVNLNRDAVKLRAEESHATSLVAALAAHRERDDRSRLLERVLRIYLAAVLAVAVAGGVAWAVFARDLVAAMQVFLSVLVVSCPCALGVALPLLDQRAAAALQPLGVFVRTATLWRRLLATRQILLDKTGTLTLERPQLVNARALDDLDSESRAALVSLAAASLHPLSRSLFEALGGDPHGNAARNIDELPGLGVRFAYASARWSLGRPAWTGRDDTAPPASDSHLACELRRDGSLVARFEFAESPRPEAREALAALRSQFGIDATLLSGDQDARVKALAASLGLDPSRAHGGLSPHDKLAAVRELDRRDTLYLGDGANDSLAFDAANACGTPAADRSVLDSKADFFFTAKGLGFLPRLFTVARWRHVTASRIIGLAVAYNLVAVAICLAGAMSPLLAAILMPLSSLACLALAASSSERVALSPAKRQPPLQCQDNHPLPAGEIWLESS